MNRRRFIGSGVGTAAMAVLTARSGPAAAASPSVIKPKRLAAGDTVGIVAPASATFNTVDLQIARESLEALGFKVQVGGHVLDRHGYLAGEDGDRAADINRFFADPAVRAVLPCAAAGAPAGCCRPSTTTPSAATRRSLLGYSDITALHMAIPPRPA